MINLLELVGAVGDPPTSPGKTASPSVLTPFYRTSGRKDTVAKIDWNSLRFSKDYVFCLEIVADFSFSHLILSDFLFLKQFARRKIPLLHLIRREQRDRKDSAVLNWSESLESASCLWIRKPSDICRYLWNCIFVVSHYQSSWERLSIASWWQQ